MKFIFYAIIATLAFYVLSVNALLLPYAPWKWVELILRYSAPGVASVILVAMCFFWRRKGTTLWQDKTRDIDSFLGRLKKFFEFIVFVPMFFFVMGFSVYRWPGYLTIPFADRNFSGSMSCVQEDSYGSRSRSFVILKLSTNDGEILEVPWRKSDAPICPGAVSVTAKSSTFGVYFIDIK